MALHRPPPPTRMYVVVSSPARMALKPCTGSGRKMPVSTTTSPGFMLRHTSPRRWMETVRGVAPSGTWGGEEVRRDMRRKRRRDSKRRGEEGLSVLAATSFPLTNRMAQVFPPTT